MAEEAPKLGEVEVAVTEARPTMTVTFDTDTELTSTSTSRYAATAKHGDADADADAVTLPRTKGYSTSTSDHKQTGRKYHTKFGTVDYRHSATLPKGMSKYSVLLEPSTPTRSSTNSRRYQRANSYTYVPRNFDPRKVRDYDEDEETTPLDLDFDDQLTRPRQSSIVCLKLDEIERQVLELDPAENNDMKKGLRQIKYNTQLALENHDQALRRSRRLDKNLLDSFYEKIDEINEDLTQKHNACLQSFNRLAKACNRVPFERPALPNVAPTTQNIVYQHRHSNVPAYEEPLDATESESRRLKQSLDLKMREFRSLLKHPRSISSEFGDLSLDKKPTPAHTHSHTHSHTNAFTPRRIYYHEELSNDDLELPPIHNRRAVSVHY